MNFENLYRILREINPRVYAHFDRLAVRCDRVPRDVEAVLRANCRTLKIRRGRRLNTNDRPRLVSIYVPNEVAIRALDRLPRAYLTIAEIAVDYIVRYGQQAERLFDGFMRHHVLLGKADATPRHYRNGGFTTRTTPAKGERNRGHWVQFYSDKPRESLNNPSNVAH